MRGGISEHIRSNVVGYVAIAQLNAVAALPDVENLREALKAGTDSEDMPPQIAA